MKTIIAFLLLCSQVFATSLCVRVTEAPGVNGYGTAVVIDEDANRPNRWIAITARHVVANATEDNTHVAIGGGWTRVQSLHHFGGADDVAFITFNHPKRFKLASVAKDDPGRGQMIEWSGYSGGKKFEKFTATVEKVSNVAFARGETLPRQGQSGGGVYDSKQRLCGIVSGYATETGELIYTPMCHIQSRCQRQWGFGIGIGIGGGRVVQPNPAPVFTPRPPAEVEPDIAPPPPTDNPSEPTPNEKSADKPSVDIQRQLDELRELIKAIPGCKCLKNGDKPSASIGPPCRCGDSCKGKCGGECKCDLQKMTDELALLKAKIGRLKPDKIPVELMLPDGTVYDRATYDLGDTLKFKFSEEDEPEEDK